MASMESTTSTTLSDTSTTLHSFSDMEETRSVPLTYGTQNQGLSAAPATHEPLWTGALDRGTSTGPGAEPGVTQWSVTPAEADKERSTSLPAAPASYETSTSRTATTSLTGSSILTNESTYADQSGWQTTGAGRYTTASGLGKKDEDETESAPQYGIWLPLVTCLLVLFLLIFMMVYLISSGYGSAEQEEYLRKAGKTSNTPVPGEYQEPTTTKWPLPAGHVGGPCNTSVPCLGHSQCLRGVCRCDGPNLIVIKGVCTLKTTRTARTRRVTRTTHFDGTTLPPVVLFTHVRTVRLLTGVPTSASDSTAHRAKGRAHEHTNRTEGFAAASNSTMPITKGFQKRAQNRSSKRAVTRSANLSTERGSTGKRSDSKPTKHSVNETKERSGSSIAERSAEPTTGRNRYLTTQHRPNDTVGRSANQTTKVSGSDTVPGRSASRTTEVDASRTTQRSVNHTAESATKGTAEKSVSGSETPGYGLS